MNPTKHRPVSPPERVKYDSLQCKHCNTITPLTESQQALRFLGLFPAHCHGCRRIRPSASHPAVQRFLRGGE